MMFREANGIHQWAHVPHPDKADFEKWVRERILDPIHSGAAMDRAFFKGERLVYTLTSTMVDGSDQWERANTVLTLHCIMSEEDQIEEYGRPIDDEIYLLFEDGSVRIPSWLT